MESQEGFEPPPPVLPPSIYRVDDCLGNNFITPGAFAIFATGTFLLGCFFVFLFVLVSFALVFGLKFLPKRVIVVSFVLRLVGLKNTEHARILESQKRDHFRLKNIAHRVRRGADTHNPFEFGVLYIVCFEGFFERWVRPHNASVSKLLITKSDLIDHRQRSHCSLVGVVDRKECVFDFDTALCVGIVRSLFRTPGQLTIYVGYVERFTVSLEDPHGNGGVLQVFLIEVKNYIFTCVFNL
jgi:hypothetical protein